MSLHMYKPSGYINDFYKSSRHRLPFKIDNML